MISPSSHSRIYHGKSYLKTLLFHSNTCPGVLFPTTKTAGLYHFPFKSYKNSAQATYFQKWIIIRIILMLFSGFDVNLTQFTYALFGQSKFFLLHIISMNFSFVTAFIFNREKYQFILKNQHRVRHTIYVIVCEFTFFKSAKYFI